MNPADPLKAAPSPGLFVLICGLPLTDFLQTGVVAFNAAPILGDIGASPEEYSLVATLYAVVAIGTIFNHRWLVERLGWRTVMVGCCALFAIGALGCARSSSLAAFAGSRMLMAMGASSFLTASRVLVNHIPPSPRRFLAIRFLASGIAWGAVLGPLVASLAWTHGSWRLAFYSVLVPAAVLGALSWRVLPSDREGGTSRPPFLPLLVLLGGSFLMLYGLQRANFSFFAASTALAWSASLALLMLALAVWLSLREATPTLAFGKLAQVRYLVGLSIFMLCYVVLGANNTTVPILLRGLQLPLETVDRTIAWGALGGVMAWIAMARLLPRSQGPTRYYLASFSLLGLGGLLISRLSESAHPVHDVVPGLLANGAFIICALSTTALQTFQTLQYDDAVLSNGNQVKNMLSQIGVALGVTLATLCLQWRGALHQTHLAESTASTNPALQQTLDSLGAAFASAGDPTTAARLSLAQLGSTLTQEASLLAALDYFWALTRFSLVVLGLVLLEHVIHRWWSSMTAIVEAPAARG